MDALSELKALSVFVHMFLLWSPACYIRMKAGLTELHKQPPGEVRKKVNLSRVPSYQRAGLTWTEPSFAASPGHKA